MTSFWTREVEMPVPFQPEELQPIIFEIGDRPDFPIEALGPLRDAVEYIQMRTLAPVEIAAQSVLAVTSSVAQGFANVDRGLLGGVSPISLFAITIAESGERKSACDSLARKPLDDFEQQYHQLYQEAYRRWKARHVSWERRYEQYQARLNSADDEEEGTIDEEEPIEPVPPVSPQRYSTEPTIEGLIQLLRRSHPAQAILSDEGGQFLGGYSMSADQAQKTMASINDMWGGKPIKRTRVSDGTYILFGRRLSMHLMVQKGVAVDLFADPKARDMGFLARCLMVEPRSLIGHREALDELPDDAAFQLYRRRIAELLGRDLDYHNGNAPEDGRISPHDGALNVPTLFLSDAATDALKDYYNQVEREQRPGGEYEEIKSFASKSPEQAARIAGVLAIYRDDASTSIDLADIKNGIDLARYYLLEAKRLMDRAPARQTFRHAQKLSCWLSERSEKFECFTPSDLQRSGPASCGCRIRPKLEKMLKVLGEYKHITLLNSGTEVAGKSRNIAYRLHPELCRRGND